jgi:hypothetical protein
MKISGGGLVGDCVHHTKHVLAAMIDLAHKQALPAFFLAPFALCNILSGTNHTDGASLGRGTLEMRKPVSLHPSDLATYR